MSRRRRRSRSSSAPSRPLGRLSGWRLGFLAAAVVATALAFSGAARAPFAFDDIPSIPGNPTIERLWPPSVPLHPPPAIAVSGRPVVNYSLAFNYAVNQWLGVDQRAASAAPNETVGYHVLNILIHLCAGLLLFGVVRRTLWSGEALAAWAPRADGVAAAVALLWLLHPIQTEAVDYVIQRTELLVSLFYLATLYASIRAWDAAGRRWRAGWSVVAVLACLLGMGSKEVMVSAPIAVVLYDRVFRVSSWRSLLRGHRLRLYAALAATELWLVVLVAGGARRDAVGFHLGIPWYRYLYSQAWAIGHYLWLVLWPSALTFDYGLRAVAGWRPLPGLIVVVALAAITIAAWRRPATRWFAFLGTLFFMILAPSSSVVPITTEIAAERRMYLALAPLLVVVVVVVVGVVVGADVLRRRWLTADGASTGAARRLRLAVARPAFIVSLTALVAALCGARTYTRSRVYENPEALWRDAMRRVPSNARAYDNVAALVLQHDSANVADAMRLWRQAIAVDSTYLPAWTNLSQVLLDRGDDSEARGLLQRALAINPDYVEASAQLGGLLVKLGDDSAALPYLERVNAQFPAAPSLVTLASAYMALGRPDDAARALRRAVALDPHRGDALGYLGGLLLEQGHPDQAVPYLESAAREGAPPLTLALLSFACAQTGRMDEAVSVATAAGARGIADPAADLLFGRAMLAAQHITDAEQFFSRAAQLAPSDPEPVTRLGIAKAAEGKSGDAERLFRRALVLKAAYPPAEQALAALRAAGPADRGNP